MSAPRILSLGEVLWDLLPEGAQFGGAPANFACHAALLGAEVAILSAVGDDPRGKEAVDILSQCGLDVSLVQVLADAPTGTVGVSLDAAGKPTFTIHEGSAWDNVAWTPEVETRVQEASAVYFGTLGQRGDVSRTTIRRALDVAKAAGIPRVLDVNLRAPFFDDALIRESIAQCSILKLSDDELSQVAAACGIDTTGTIEETLRALLEQNSLDLAVMTRGAEGALLASATESVDQPGIPVEVNDTIGAGDAFTAAMIVGLLAGKSLTDIARQACERASATCAHAGAVPTS